MNNRLFAGMEGGYHGKRLSLFFGFSAVSVLLLTQSFSLPKSSFQSRFCGWKLVLPERTPLSCPSWSHLHGHWEIWTSRRWHRFAGSFLLVQDWVPRIGIKSQDYGSFGKIISSNASKILLLLLIPRARNYPQSSCLFTLSKPECCPSTCRRWALPELTV